MTSISGWSRPPVDSFWTMSGGMISAASAWPERTLSIAWARLLTGIGSIAVKNLLAYCWPLIFSPPRSKLPCPLGTSLRNATFGLLGPRESA